MDRREAFDDDGVWAGTLRTAAGVLTGWHVHAGHDTYLYVVAGSLTIESGPGGGLRAEASAGDFVLIPRGLMVWVIFAPAIDAGALRRSGGRRRSRARQRGPPPLLRRALPRLSEIRVPRPERPGDPFERKTEQVDVARARGIQVDDPRRERFEEGPEPAGGLGLDVRLQRASRPARR